MDVRCETCQTVYEFDEARIGPNGVTVKCTQCNSLFKVKRKEGPAPRMTERGMPEPPPAPRPPGDDWQLKRVSTGEIFRVRGMAALGEWVTERKALGDDQLSRDGRNWMALSAVPELQAIFARLRPPSPIQRPAREKDPALVSTAPQNFPADFAAHSKAIADASSEPAFTQDPSEISLPGIPSELAAASVRSRRQVLFAGVIGVVVIAVVLGSVVHRMGRKAEAVMDEDYQAARALFFRDEESSFAKAEPLFEKSQLRAAGGSSLALAGLAELHGVWAWYLNEDLRSLTGPNAEVVGRTLKREMQAHLDRSKRFATEALSLSPDTPEVNRAMAQALCVDGAPTAEVDRYLKRVSEKQPSDAEAAYVRAVLAYREGRQADAITHLKQASQLRSAASQPPLVRASFLLGKLLAAEGKKDEAQKELEPILVFNRDHERTKTLLTSLAVAVVDASAPVEPPKVDAGRDAAAVIAKPTQPLQVAPVGDEPTVVPSGNLQKLIAQAERLLENGKVEQARKLYERAQILEPNNTDILTGLGYCDLEAERFMSAVERFKQALTVSANNGEAIIGLAEAHKIRGNREQALEFYKKYLQVFPSGPKAGMAQKNVRDLGPREALPAPTPLPKPPPAEEKEKEPEKKEPEKEKEPSAAAPSESNPAPPP